MINDVVGYFKEGAKHIASHRQLLLALALLVLIPLAFLWTGQQFLSVSKYNLERVEKDRIGILHDVFSAVLQSPVSRDTLQLQMNQLVTENPDLEKFSIFAQSGNELETYVSAGDVFDSEAYSDIIRLSAVRSDESILFEEYTNGERNWIGVRSVLDDSGFPAYFIATDVSMETLDSILKSKIRSAYFSLTFVVLLILVLLWRQVRLIDYSRLYTELKDAHATMSLFVNMTAHELRTPLTVIKGYASILREDTSLSPANASYAENIETSSNSLIALISDLLDLASFQSGKLQFEKKAVDLGDVILRTTTFLQPLAKEHSLLLRADVGAHGTSNITGDEKRLVQVFTNIISNSLKYTKEGTITVALQTIGKKFEIRIKDTGVGISAEDQKRLFAPYFRVANADTSKITGTGLGMWITKRMIEEMGGTIDVESIKDVGTHIVVTFPAT